MDDLIARLEAATEGSRELSDEVLVALGWTHDTATHTSCAPDGTRYGYDTPYSRPPHPTRSADDALGLPMGEWRVVHAYWSEGKAHFTFGRPIPEGETRTIWVDGVSHTPALAYCAAILRARGDDHG